MEKVQYVESKGGVKIAFMQWKGTDLRAHLILSHATGFSKEMWIPVVEELRKSGVQFPATALDFRGHGDSVMKPPFYYGKGAIDLRYDVLAVAEFIKKQYGEQMLIGLGLSFGSTSLTMAEILHPGLFEALILVEPIIYPVFGTLQRTENHPFVRKALSRKTTFPNLQSAKEYYAGKFMMSTWDPRSLESYVKGILRLKNASKPDEGYELKCHPEAEAEIYKVATENDLWLRLSQIKCPVSLIAGELSDVYSKESLDIKKIQSRFTNAKSVEHLVVAKVGHLIPLERPDIISSHVCKFLTALKILRLAKL